MGGGKLLSPPPQKKGGKKGNHEFLNPIVGSKAAQAAAVAVAAGVSNAVIEATCRVRVRPCRPCVCVSVKEREIDGCLGFRIPPQASQLQWVAASCFYKEPLVFWGPPVRCPDVREAQL